MHKVGGITVHRRQENSILKIKVTQRCDKSAGATATRRPGDAGDGVPTATSGAAATRSAPSLPAQRLGHYRHHLTKTNESEVN